MLNNEQIQDGLLNIIKGIRNPPAILNFVPLPYTRGRFDDLVLKCIDLHKDLIAGGEEDNWSNTQRFFLIESEYKKLRTKLMLMPSILIVYLGFLIIVVFIKLVNFTGFIKEVLKVDAPERLITFGVSGAFLYLATSVLSNISKSKEGNDAISKVADFSIRILLAILVPILLVSLFFTSDGKLSEVKISPELLAFSCGYSAKLVVETLNKVVEKISKMLEVI